ncbi:hypothetical protein L798_07421 [Zootermopsis nevadensis]|uniref:Uncharacterized protein n=1 Tax=Zootermopsis nevadensis TaxID=136037 RepID=A0A067RE02_ZOONE|nr:hypothetical protein L798_07421 [Zootermopsis nevadensis]
MICNCSASVYGNQDYEGGGGNWTDTLVLSVHVTAFILNFLALIMYLDELIIDNRRRGDPTMPHGHDPTGEDGTNFNNPGFRARRINNSG